MPPASATARLELSAPLEAPRPQAVLPTRPAAVPSSRQPAAWPLVRALRPRQWLKNAVVLIAPATAGALSRPGAASALLGAFVAFCLMSSATYLINDVRDREADRRHPRKRLRPVAAGEISVATALGAAVMLGASSCVVALLVRPTLAVVVLGYAALTLSYALLWRQVVVMDVLVISSGFVLRAVAGGAAVGISLSSSFLLVTSACALFLIVGKRHAELVDPARTTAARATLERYSQRGLRLLLIISAGVGCAAYASWSLSRPASGPWLGLSLIPFGLWLARYAGLVRAGAGETPEEIVLRDGGLMLLSVLWMLLFMAGIYGSG